MASRKNFQPQAWAFYYRTSFQYFHESYFIVTQISLSQK